MLWASPGVKTPQNEFWYVDLPILGWSCVRTEKRLGGVYQNASANQCMFRVSETSTSREQGVARLRTASKISDFDWGGAVVSKSHHRG